MPRFRNGPPALHLALEKLGLNDEEFAALVVTIGHVQMHRVEIHRLRTRRREIKKVSVEKVLAMLKVLRRMGLRELTIDELVNGPAPEPPPQRLRAAG